MAEQDHAEQGAVTVAETPQITTFEDLACWKKCRELRLFVAKEAIPALPKEERYRLGEQLLRAARSTTANIAEGYGRFHFKENIQFCRHSRGSLYEILDDLITCLDEKYITETVFEDGKNEINRATNILNGYINYLKRAEEQKRVAPINS